MISKQVNMTFLPDGSKLDFDKLEDNIRGHSFVSNFGRSHRLLALSKCRVLRLKNCQSGKDV